MDRVIVYSAINTKIRILERGFLSRQDYSNMLQMTSVSQVASYLKENTSTGTSWLAYRPIKSAGEILKIL